MFNSVSMDATSNTNPPPEDIPFVPEWGFYQPSSEQTWEAYQALLSVVEYQSRANLRGVVLCGVADEILSVLKTNNIKSLPEKKVEIERILIPFPDFIFDQLVSTAELITDYPTVCGAMDADDHRQFYQPRREDTWRAYKLLLDFVEGQLGCEQPQTVKCLLAHEVLVILKDTTIESFVKRRMINNTTMNLMSDNEFDKLLSIGELISDFDVGPAGNEVYGGSATASAGFQSHASADDDEYMNPTYAIGVVRETAAAIDDDEFTTPTYNIGDDEYINPTYAIGDDDESINPTYAIGIVHEKAVAATDDDEYINPTYAIGVVHETGSSSVILRDEEENMRLSFEKVHIAGKEDEGDWVMVDPDPQM